MKSEQLKVVVAGATGFIGEAIGIQLEEQFHLIALSRSARQRPRGYRSCRTIDLFSRADSIRALEGADVAVYLVHSMMPQARLVQARFQELDLLCADNFGRAAAANRVKQIIYVDESFGSNYVSEKAAKQSHQPALHIKGKGDDDKGQEESNDEGGGEQDAEEGEEE